MVITSSDELWKVHDVARFLSMSPSWVYKEAEAGRLPCVRIGAALRFSSLAIKHYLAGLHEGSPGGHQGLEG
jgi:predicted DNA-binding transcriptional regulator AlpA